jgi:hypothetical protein
MDLRFLKTKVLRFIGIEVSELRGFKEQTFLVRVSRFLGIKVS